MRIGGSLFLIAVGAILKWAITDHVNHVNLATVGVILMVIGLVGLVLSLVLSFTRQRTDVIHRAEVPPEDVTRYDAAPYEGNARTTYVQPRPYDPR